ncbi:MAG: restriction endonuclease subunit S [Wenzhouxiangella sp.]
MKADRLLRAFSMLGEEPAHIQQLRQVVVALAISRRLTSDSSALSAGEMLRKVEQVKTELYRRRSIPKPRKLAPIEQSELPSSFSGDGQFAALGSLARIEKGLTRIKQARPGGFPLVVTGAGRKTCDHFDFDGAAAIIPLVSSTGHGHASIHRLHYQEGKFALGTILAAAFPYDTSLISARFIFEYLSAFKDELLVPRMTGTANVTLSIGRIAEVPVPLVDPDTQEKLDDLMGMLDRLDAARQRREETRDRLTVSSLARLTAADAEPETFPTHARFALDTLPALTTRPDQIKQLRQTILNLAVRGKLVEQDPKELIADSYSDCAEFTWLPPTWRTLNFGKNCDIQGGNQPPKSQFTDEPRQGYVRLLQIRDLGKNPVPVYIPEGSTNRFCRDGEILIGRYGASVGKIFWAQDGAYNVALAKFVWPCDAFTANFAFILLQSDLFQDHLAGASRSAQAGFNKGDLRDIEFPLPPLAEQHRIVSKVDALMAICDQLEAALTAADTSRTGLLEALLHEALTETTTAREAA